MAATSILPPITGTATSAPASTTSSSGSTSSSSSSSTGVDAGTLADNFQTFLTLLTTQLQNQNPLDPLDTNQFTQQLVQFAQVEQQMKQNDQLTTLINLQKTSQSTEALGFVGAQVAVDGQNAALTNSQAAWLFTSPKPATAAVTIKSSTGETAYSGSFSVNAGAQAFTWDGRGNNGTQWPDGNYTLSVVGTDASGNSVSLSTEIVGAVDSVDLTQSPPTLSIGGVDYTIDKVKRVLSPAGSSAQASQ